MSNRRYTLFLTLLAAFLCLTASLSALASEQRPSPRRPVLAPIVPATRAPGLEAVTTPTVAFYFPFIHRNTGIVLGPPLPPPIPVGATPPIDFEAIRAGLQANGQDLAFVKIGFHTGIGGNANGLGDWFDQLDAAGVPFFIKSVDSAGPVFEAQEIARNSDVPHVLVYRKSGPQYDVPDYNLPPAQAAQNHWQLHKSVFPPELDPRLVWLETVNEIDKNRSEWLAEFALETAQLALADGFRWAAFAWSSGEPEVEHWQGPAMLEFLRFAGDHPDDVAIALHEYSYTIADIADQYPYKVGRFQFLFQVCDENNIPRPTVLITEWGWEYENVPDVTTAMGDIAWASWLYSYYPQVQGAAIWYLGGGFGNISDQAQRLIAPLRDYSKSNYFIISQGQGQIDTELLRP